MSKTKRELRMMAAAEDYAAEIYDEVTDFDTDEEVNKTINDFIAGWRAADSHPQWIPVEERLPNERQVVWVRKHFKRKYVGEFDIYDSAAFCNGEFQCDASENVTHWMEIQPPRKEGKNE